MQVPLTNCHTSGLKNLTDSEGTQDTTGDSLHNSVTCST